jgi:hydroxymethylpyrimidine/phosphomethylpyrimidine kinase
MLASGAIVRTVVRALQEHDLHPFVLDPVLVASTGRRLLSRDGIAALRRRLLPLADLVTPNLAEAAALTGEPVTDLSGMLRAARILVDQRGARAALITGGHLKGETVVDVLYDGTGAPTAYRAQRIATRHLHGTGCTLSAAIVARLALGESMAAAVREARAYVRRAIRTAPLLGAAGGPLNHRG